MKKAKGFDFDFENDPEGIIAEAISMMIRSLETTSDKLSESLLHNLFNKTNMRDPLLDEVFMCELFDALYITHRFLKGLPNKQLDEQEFNNIFLSWHILLWIEIARRNKAIVVEPFIIFDFDNLPDTQVDLKLDKITLQTLMN